MWVKFLDGDGNELTDDTYDSDVRRSVGWEQYGISNYVVPASTRSVSLIWNAW